MPVADPAFLAFERQLHASENDLRGTSALRKDALQRSYARKLPFMDRELEDQKRGVQDNFLSRGVAKSGTETVRLNEADRDMQMKKGLLAAENSDAQAGIEIDLARQLAEMKRRMAEAQLEAQGRMALSPYQASLGQ